MDKCTCNKIKIREKAERKALLNRLARIEGQLRGIRSMVENNAYCPDILTQTAAVNAAIDAFSRALLASHIRSCVTEDIRQGKDEVVDELLSLLRKMMH